MSWWKHAKVGDKLVCVEDGKLLIEAELIKALPVEGEVYTVRDVDAAHDGVYFMFDEIRNEKVMTLLEGYGEPSFHHEGFRPVDRTGRQMERLRGLLRPSTVGVSDRHPVEA